MASESSIAHTAEQQRRFITHNEKKDSFDWRTRPNSLKHRVWDRVVSDVPDTSYRGGDDYSPLQKDTSRKTIASCVKQFNEGDYSRTDGVYVLECCQSPIPVGQAILDDISEASIKRYYNLNNPRRVLYVGVSEDVPQRLDQHLNDPGNAGANFTAIYCPFRVLQIGWFSNYGVAERAEVITAEFLREKFPQDFVAQPG